MSLNWIRFSAVGGVVTSLCQLHLAFVFLFAVVITILSPRDGEAKIGRQQRTAIIMSQSK
jgi:hypothetical protein